jgi:hypothetical protein
MILPPLSGGLELKKFLPPEPQNPSPAAAQGIEAEILLPPEAAKDWSG